MSEGFYDVAQICLNGHLINYSVKRYPQHNKKYCNKCGEPTITKCKYCDVEIQGKYYVPGIVGITDYKVPAFCHNCGKPYSWTESRIKAAHELTKEIENISADEKKILNRSIDELVKDSPRTTLAVTRFKKLLPKTGKFITEAFREILIDIISETAKKSLWP